MHYVHYIIAGTAVLLLASLAISPLFKRHEACKPEEEEKRDNDS